MLLPLTQVLLICSLILFAVIPVSFVVLGCNYLVTGKHGRVALVIGFFVVGALLSAFLVWHAVPSEWNLAFWTTLKTTVAAERYGHATEHYAEGIVVMMTFAAVLGGIFCAVAAALGAKLLRKLAHP